MDISNYKGSPNFLSHCLITKTKKKKTVKFLNFLREIMAKFFESSHFIEFTLSPLNGVSNRYYLAHLKQCSCPMSTNMF